MIPASQSQAMEQVRRLVEGSKFSRQMERHYENLIGEMDANIDLMDDNMGEGIRYALDLQIVHENSKRFLCVYPSERMDVNKHFDQGYLDNECY